MLGLAEIFVLLVFFLIGVGGVTAIVARASGHRRRHVQGDMAQVLEELSKVNDRLNG
ncbi:hypothetical protein HN937_30110, partial [Candidatus Poribacteria bacterium]|nr:hypothetical protein [Candidatus Poribacteria bacterium]